MIACTHSFAWQAQIQQIVESLLEIDELDVAFTRSRDEPNHIYVWFTSVRNALLQPNSSEKSKRESESTEMSSGITLAMTCVTRLCKSAVVNPGPRKCCSWAENDLLIFFSVVNQERHLRRFLGISPTSHKQNKQGLNLNTSTHGPWTLDIPVSASKLGRERPQCCQNTRASREPWPPLLLHHQLLVLTTVSCSIMCCSITLCLPEQTHLAWGYQVLLQFIQGLVFRFILRNNPNLFLNKNS